MGDPRNAFISLVEPPPGERPALPEGDHQWLRAELSAYLAHNVSPLAVALALLAHDFDTVAPLWAALAEMDSFQALLREPRERRDAITDTAFTLLVTHVEQLEELSGGGLWDFLSERRCAHFAELLAACPGRRARLLLARHLLSQPDLVGAGWGDGPTAINGYLAETGDEALAAGLASLDLRLPASVLREIERRFPGVVPRRGAG